MPSTTGHCKRLLLSLLIHVFLGIQLSNSLAIYNNQTATPAPCRPDQASALHRLKRSFSSRGWGVVAPGSICTLASWRVGTDCCGWEGVRCSDAEGLVTTLDLRGCGLESGALHPALFDLTSLRYLDLAWNSFNGSELPAVGFEQLNQLIYLNLSNCEFSGHIPDGIKRLSKLVSLDLSSKLFLLDIYHEIMMRSPWLPQFGLVEPNIGSLVASLSNLKELHLDRVDLSGNGAAWCNAFANSTPQLQVLSLPYTGLHGPICVSLSSIHSLTVVDLQLNKINGQIPESFADLPSLTVLNFFHNDLEGSFPMRIFKNKNLRVLDISCNSEISGLLPNFSYHSTLTDLLVSSTNFSGPIPRSINNLKSLNKLGIAAVDFPQELPSTIGELRSLSRLEMSGTGIVGEFPSWIANLTSLVHLQFSNCGLSGRLPSFIGNLKNLTRLQLYRCNFSGPIPPQLSNLTQLEILNIGSNNFQGTIKLSSFFNKPSDLSILDLSNNILSVIDGEINSSRASIKNMYRLRLASCNMSRFPTMLRYMSLQVLDLSDNQIHGAIPQWAWENWKKLYILDLSHNQFSGVPNLLGDISMVNISFNLFEGPIPMPGPDMKLLDCSNNQFSSIPLKFGTQLNQFFYFKASENNLSGNIPPSICEATSLVLLDLSNNNLSGSIPSCLMDISSLSVLNLERNKLNGEFPHNMNQGCAIKALDFSDNWIEGQLPRSLGGCKELEVFNIGNNRINDSFPCWMSMLPELQVLVLKSNKFVGKVGPSVLGDEENCEFLKLRIFDVASNNFFGTLPNEWFKNMRSMITESTDETLVMKAQHSLDYTEDNLVTTFRTTITLKGYDITFSKILKTLVVIDVSNNAFEGAIPMSIGDLVRLTGVNMSHNALTGQIPSQLDTLHQLEVLDLSSNDLSGEIPQELATLNYLSMLNLSYNKLVGRIPYSTQFSTFTNLSFLGNIGLCGLQVSKNCNVITPNVVLHHPERKPIDIILFLFVGLGYGVGFAVAIVLTCGIRVRRRSQGNNSKCWKKVFFFM